MKNGSCEHQHRFGEKNMEFCENVRVLSTLVLTLGYGGQMSLLFKKSRAFSTDFDPIYIKMILIMDVLSCCARQACFPYAFE